MKLSKTALINVKWGQFKTKNQSRLILRPIQRTFRPNNIILKCTEVINFNTF